MAKQIDISSFECDCGHQSHFFENTIREMLKMSARRGANEIGLGSSDPPPHGIIFSRGQIVAIKCPKLGKLPIHTSIWGPAAPSSPDKATPTMKTRPPFTKRQGQFLAFIHLYTKLNRRAPAESDIEAYFGVASSSVHSMITTLRSKGLIASQPGMSRSIRLLVDPSSLPPLN
jgi:repressor LexA